MADYMQNENYIDMNMMNQQQGGFTDPAKQKYNLFYKSKLCIHWQTKGMCAKAETCSYAHGETELRQIPPEYLSHSHNQAAVSTFSLNNEDQSNITAIMQNSLQGQLFNPFWKTKMCNFYLQGKCRNTIDCNYAHVEDELRDPNKQAFQSIQNLVQIQDPEYRLRLIHYNAAFQKNLLESAKNIYEQIQRMQNIHQNSYEIQEILEEAKLLVFQQEIEQATFKVLRPDCSLDEREQHVDVKNKIKESFEQPEVQFPNDLKFSLQDVEKMKYIMESEQGTRLPVPMARSMKLFTMQPIVNRFFKDDKKKK